MGSDNVLWERPSERHSGIQSWMVSKREEQETVEESIIISTKFRSTKMTTVNYIQLASYTDIN